MIEIFPAIDLHNGQAVRLKQGDYNQVEVFFKNPVEVLDFFNKNNSKNLHIVDLDGAKDGMLNGTNLEIYKKLSKIVKSDIIASGGITFLDEIKELNENGVYGAIVGKAIYSGNLDLKEVLEVSK